MLSVNCVPHIAVIEYHCAMAAKLTRLHSLRERLGATFSSHPNELIALFSK
jgi:hypothetical protein